MGRWKKFVKRTGAMFLSLVMVASLLPANITAKTIDNNYGVVGAADENGNYIVNGDFEEEFQALDHMGASPGYGIWYGTIPGGSIGVEDHEAVIHIDSYPGANWQGALRQRIESLDAAEYYLLSFEAYSTIARPIQLETNDIGTGSNQKTVYLTEQKETYYIAYPSDNSKSGAASLMFMVGNVDGCLDTFKAHKIHIDNVELTTATQADIDAVTPPSVSLYDLAVLGEDIVFSYEQNDVWEVDEKSFWVDGEEIDEEYVTIDHDTLTITIDALAFSTLGITSGLKSLIIEADNYSETRLTFMMLASESNLLAGDWTFSQFGNEQGSMELTGNNSIDVTFVESLNNRESLKATMDRILIIAPRSYVLTFDAELEWEDSTSEDPLDITINGLQTFDMTISAGKSSYTSDKDKTAGGHHKNFSLGIWFGGHDADVAPHTLKLTNMMLSDVSKPKITKEPVSAEYTSGGTDAEALTVEATTSVTYEGDLSYQWYSNTTQQFKNALAITDATSATYTPELDTVGTTYYYCVVTELKIADDGFHIIKTIKSAITSITVTPAIPDTPVFTNNLENATYTQNTTATALDATATVTDNGDLTYQWYSNTVNSTSDATIISDATSAAYTPSTTAVGTTYYYCVATNTIGLESASAASNIAKITVNSVIPATPATPNFTNNLVNATYTQNGAATALNATATVSDGGSLTYQWYSNTENSTSDATIISDATSATYTPSTTVVGTTYYYCVATNTIGSESTPATSNIAKITVNSVIPATPATPNFTNNLVNATYTQNGTATALNAAATVSDGGSLTYQWYSNTENSTSDATIISDATSATYTPSTAVVGTTYYYCVATNTIGLETTPATSNIAKITVEAAKPDAAAKPSITKQPASATYTYGDKATALSVTASVTDDGTLSYQWYKNSANNTSGTSIAGATQAAYTPAVSAAGVTYYYCIVTNTNNDATVTKTSGATSSIAKAEVKKAANNITVTAKWTRAYGSGTFSLNAKSLQGALTYKPADDKVVTVDKNGKVTIRGCGVTTITITSAGNANYNATTKSISITVTPKKATVSSFKSTKTKRATVKWKQDKTATGYEIQYSTDKSFKKNVQRVPVNKNGTISRTLTKLTKGRTYYVRVRATGKNKTVGGWSQAKSVKVK